MADSGKLTLTSKSVSADEDDELMQMASGRR